MPATPLSRTRRRTIITGAPPRDHGRVACHATVTPPPRPAPEAGARRTYASRATGVAPEDRTACGDPATAAHAVGGCPSGASVDYGISVSMRDSCIPPSHR
ncbi:hypothetical protein GCM10023324_53750 [Streptomyces youssoufiensis]